VEREAFPQARADTLAELRRHRVDRYLTQDRRGRPVAPRRSR
jgi:hypothetical protein